ncbi:Sden_1168 family B12-binding radical SAM P-methyltransferase [Burkholderia stabilis]|uniref:Uncharacterized protein n=1 Tax=Burkholderia stabilis TaxID=95485 RepID=A0A1Y1C1A5_9BURK|nr:Sden_1168 family B12-binding radical SAM P-methyltransferase [Burkholderia stabilis]BAX63807.1 hypothetical protein BSFP_066800 [Burkholderia stabilis]
MDNPLKAYLSLKDETSAIKSSSVKSDLLRIGAPLKCKPKILLILPPSTLSDGAVKRVIPPLGLCYIAGTLDHAGYDVEIADLVAEGVEHEEKLPDGRWVFGLPPLEIERRLSRVWPDIIGISVIYSSDVARAIEVAAIAKRVHPTAKIVIGGLHATIYPNDFLEKRDNNDKPLFDFLIRGEGELRMLNLVRHLEAGVIDRNGDGLCWTDGTTIHINPQRKTIDNLDGLTFPSYEKIPIEGYFNYNVPFSPFPKGKRVVQLLTSRGCPVGCTFCASTNFQKIYRTRSVRNVIEEVEFLKNKFNIDEIQFADDNLTFDRRRAINLFDELAKFRLPWCTPNGIMLNTLNDELMNSMVASGMYQITLSIDGGTKRTLKELHRKPVHLDRVPYIAQYFHNRGVLVHATLVIGTTGETEEEINDGFEFVAQLPLTSIGVFIAQPIPGSELYESSIEQGRILRDNRFSIDTARASGRVSDIDPERLEELARQFIYSFNRKAKQRFPIEWERKYQQHLERLDGICVGRRPTANFAGIGAA